MKDHSSSGLYEETLSIFSLMRRSGVQPDHHTFPAVNKAIASLSGRLPIGETVHSISIKLGLYQDIYFCNSMIEVYVAHGQNQYARKLFDEMPEKDVVTWTSILSGDSLNSLTLFKDMIFSGFRPNVITMIVLLKGFPSRHHLFLKPLLGFLIKSGLFNFKQVQNSLMAAFCKTHHLQEAEKIFSSIVDKDVVSWNIMISGYSSAREASMVMQCFMELQASLSPSPETLTLVLSSCTKNMELLAGMKIHCLAIKISHIDDTLEACVLDLYIKCGELTSARRLFSEPRSKNSRHQLLSVMITGLDHEEALDLIGEQQIDSLDIGPDFLISILKLCSNQSCLLSGKSVHGLLLRHNCCQRIFQTSLVSMYSRCGNITLAERCFAQIAEKDLVAWSSMIEGYAAHGLGQQALHLFHLMVQYGVRPNNVTLLSVLAACSHAGMVDEGCRVFSSMVEDFGIIPEVGHVTCLVDLLGRAGKLKEAFEVARSMENLVDGRTWGALLSACRIHGETAEIACYATMKVGELEPGNVGYGVVMCNLHSSAERWVEAAEVRKGLVVHQSAWSAVGVTRSGGLWR